MTKNRFQIGVMPTILLLIFIATAFTAVNFARKPASEERRAALLEQAQPHQATAAWAERQLADQPKLSNGAAVRLQHEIRSRLKDNGLAAAPQPVHTAATVMNVVPETPAAPAEAAPQRPNATEGSRPASENWRIAIGSLAVLAAVASMLWASFRRRS